MDDIIKKTALKDERRAITSGFRAGLLGVSMLALTGCQMATLGGLNLIASTPPASASVIGDPAQDNAIQVLVRKTTAALADDKLKDASQFINLALKLDITNPDLQFLNGLTYHRMGVRGDASKYELAEQGYTQSLKFDPGNLSARYQMGLLYMDQRRYGLAQGYFAAVALHRGDDPAVLYSLASASYYARDPKTSEAALKRLLEVAPEAKDNPKILKAAALSLSAMDDREGAAQFVAAYRNTVAGAQGATALDRRVSGWQSFYDSDAKVLQAQYGDSDPYGTPYDSASDPYAPSAVQGGVADQQGANAQQGGFVDTSMVVVDVVLIGTQEDVRDSRGINLLNGLQLQFGDPLAGTVGFGMTSTRTHDGLASGLGQQTKTITRSISIPAVTYSLNIANSLNANNQVLAKPSLVAQTGQTSEFFSGTEILAAAVSGGSGDSVSVQKEVGVKLAVTPEILPDDMLRLHIVAERTFLTDPSNSVVFEFRLDTTKTNVNSTVTMKFGETLILAGLSERETSKSADGVPGLMDIPILKYLFSQRVERQFERSIMILLTPRRPHYTRQGVAERDAVEQKMSDLERDLQRLEQRHGDWYTPRPTFSELVEKLQGREFFEEFRNGDVKIQSWQKDPKGQQHITSVHKRLLGS
ncbi:MAG: hypothetical protein COB59_08645 [Rhodospirillaceae bacterium]|nr:MAG: hypothetical protein COB59_08645 [Rhodospirillaceae bacterium]